MYFLEGKNQLWIQNIIPISHHFIYIYTHTHIKIATC
jgi:hypothetical protein